MIIDGKKYTFLMLHEEDPDPTRCYRCMDTGEVKGRDCPSCVSSDETYEEAIFSDEVASEELSEAILKAMEQGVNDEIPY